MTIHPGSWARRLADRPKAAEAEEGLADLAAEVREVSCGGGWGQAAGSTYSNIFCLFK